jgi:hypothetical protein
MMSDQLDWTTSVGQAYVYQSTDVMTSIQRLRAQAHAAGNLITNQQQEVIVDEGVIAIAPAQPRYIYIPTYDSSLVYFWPPSYFGIYPSPFIFFGSASLVGVWLNHDCDWRRRRIYYHGWQGSGWIARSRPVIRITKVYVNNYFVDVHVNRNIFRRPVNYLNLNRYNSIHRDVNYNNLMRDKRIDTGKAPEGNKIIRRNLDVTNPKLDDYRGRVPAQRPAAGEKQQPPAQAMPPQRIPAPPRRVPEHVPPRVLQQPSTVIQRPPSTVFGTGEGRLDPRAATQRGQESRGRISQPPAGRPTIAPPPITRSMPGAPGRR